MSYKVLDVPQSLNCQHCVPCMRIRLMEMGFIEGQEIEIVNKRTIILTLEWSTIV